MGFSKVNSTEHKPYLQTYMTTMVIQPGELGMEHRGNVVTNVSDGGQAQLLGIRHGMELVAVNGKGFTKLLLDACVHGDENYTVTFATKVGKDVELESRMAEKVAELDATRTQPSALMPRTSKQYTKSSEQAAACS